MRPFIAGSAGVACFGVIKDDLMYPLFTVSDVVLFREEVVACCDRYLEASGSTVPEVFEEAFKRHLVVEDLMK